MPLSREQLGLSEKVLLELQDALANQGYVEPFTTAANEAEGKVSDYTTGYDLTAATLENFQRALVLFDLYTKVGSVPEAIKSSFDSAMTELRAISQGDRPNLPRSNAGANSPSTGAWGSRTKILFPGDTTE